MIELKYYDQQAQKSKIKQTKQKIKRYKRIEESIKYSLKKEEMPVAKLYIKYEEYHDYACLLSRLGFVYDLNLCLDWLFDSSYIKIIYNKKTINNLNEELKKLEKSLD